MPRSRYQLCGFSIRRSQAPSEMVKGASPGATPRHFCEPEYARSTPHSSSRTGMPPREVTQSASSRASPLPSASGTRSDRTPVEVSACTAAMSFGDGCAASTRSASTGWPQSCSTAITSAPQREATSTIRCPNSPFTATTTTSPGPTVLTNAASIPADRVADSGSVRRFAVPKIVRSRSDVSSSTCRNSGSRWPSSGWPRATVASGYGLDGPGPSRVRARNGMPRTLMSRVRRPRCPRLAGRRRLLRPDVDTGLLALLLRDRRRRAGQRVVAGAGLREGDDLADGLHTRQQGDGTVPADRGAGVRRRPVGEGLQEPAELLPGLLLRHAEGLERPLLQLGVVDADRAAGQLVAVDDQVVGVRQRVRLVLGEAL